MGIINKLDFQTANLIAAGEVVERPASACKELVENSLDSGADKITVEIKNGGVSFMRVTDNGCGMAREDVPVAVMRHATSKIRTATDLDAISTLGFRGEALAAISSVSHLRIMTKRREDAVGTLLESNAGGTPVISDTGASDGTTVIVEELFMNVPARRKFLKKDQTEAMAVTAAVEKVAMSRPSVAVRLIVDGAVRFSTAGDGKLINTVYALMGREFASRLIEVPERDYSKSSVGAGSDGWKSGVVIGGFIGTPENIRINRNYQNMFINGRYVKSRCVQASLEQAYSSYIPSDKFPSCVLFITIPPSAVDVNVHPAKLEVKFANEKEVFEAVFYAVRGALEKRIPRPTIVTEPDRVDEKKAERLLNSFVPLRDGQRTPNNDPYVNHKNVSAEQLRLTDQPVSAEKLTVKDEPTPDAVPADNGIVTPERSVPSPLVSSAFEPAEPPTDPRGRAIAEALRLSREKHDAGRPSLSSGAEIPDGVVPRRPTEAELKDYLTPKPVRRDSPGSGAPIPGCEPKNRWSEWKKIWDKEDKEAIAAAEKEYDSRISPSAAPATEPEPPRTSEPQSSPVTPSDQKSDTEPPESARDAGNPDVSPRQFGSGKTDDDYFTERDSSATDPRYAEFPRQPEPVLSRRTLDELEAEKRSGKDPRIRPAGKLYMNEGDGEGKFYDIPSYRIIGEVFYSYVMIEVGDRVMMIDKHAAHERIIFEQLKQSLKRQVPFVQLLLVPVTLKLTPTELAALTDYKKDIHSLGFNFTPLPDGGGIQIEGVPPDTVPDAAGDMLLSFAEQIISGTGSVSISRELKLERALYQMSCKAAIKAGHDEDISHIRWICDRLLALDCIKFCPHGRPVAFEMTKSQIEKRFGRE